MQNPATTQRLSPTSSTSVEMDSVDTEFQRWREEHYRGREERHRVKKDISFSIQQTVACLLTDFIDPFVGAWFQKKFGDKDKAGGTLEHNVKGELVGDFGGAVIYVGLRSLLRSPIDALARGVEKIADPMLDKAGRLHLSTWAKRHHVAEDSKEYMQMLADFKQFQADSLIDSSVMSLTTSTVNVLAQKHMFGNDQSYVTIAGSKLLGVGLTMGTVLGARTLLPDASQTLDREISDKYVSPVMHWTRNLFLDSEKEQEFHHIHRMQKKEWHVDRAVKKDNWQQMIAQQNSAHTAALS